MKIVPELHGTDYTSRVAAIRQTVTHWLRAENEYQLRSNKFSAEAWRVATNQSLLEGYWGITIGNYALRAALKHAVFDHEAAMGIVQQAGKAAATARGLYAGMYHLYRPQQSLEAASDYTLADVESAVAGADEADEYTYVGVRSLEGSPLWVALAELDGILPRPVEHGSVTGEHVDVARRVCLAGVDLFMDYTVQYHAYGSQGDWPRPGLPSGDTRPWTAEA